MKLRFATFAAAAALLTVTLALPSAASAYEAPGLAANMAIFAKKLQQKVSAVPPEQRDDLKVLRSRAADAVQGERWDDAINAYQMILGQRPTDAGVWFGLAQALQQSSPYSQDGLTAAYAAYENAGTDKLRGAALILLARGLEQQDKGREAIKVAAEGAQLAPSDDNTEYAGNLRQQYGFRVTSTYAQNDRDAPQLCADFSDPIVDGRTVRYSDYVRIEPAVPVEVIPSDKQLCLEGVSFGQAYTVTLLAGIKSVDGDVLEADDSFDLTVDDRPASVVFRGSAYVLPKGGEGTVPVTTVNISEVRLRLLRINDRNLIDQVAQGRIGQTLEGYDVDSLAQDAGEQVWAGTMPVESETNKAVVTGVPMDTVLSQPKPGVYLLSAVDAKADEDSYQTPGTQWIVVTDLGLATFSGQQGLTVAARALSSAKAQPGVKLSLLARNNSVLGEAETDAGGLAAFPAGVMAGQGGNRPAAVYAYGSGDFTFLELTGPAFDLSDRGVSGRAEPGPLDAFLYPERGVYRPGETVHLTTLLRNERAAAIDGVPLTIKVSRPDGVEARVEQATDQGGGSYSIDVPLADSAYTGTWTAEAFVDPKGQAIGSTPFQVEDFVPARIRVDLKTEAKDLRVAKPAVVNIDAQFLYGAPAADLATEASLTLQQAAQPFPDFSDYRFGLVQDAFAPRTRPITTPATDAAGQSRVDILLDGLPDTTVPLEAEIRTAVFDSSGRTANETTTLPVRQEHPWIGLKPLFSGSLAEGADARFEVIGLDAGGRPAAIKGLRWDLVEEIHDYQWFSADGHWDYKVVTRDRKVADGTVDVAPNAPAAIRQAVGAGNFRLDVYDPKGGGATSARFYAGWWVSDDPNPTPDKLTVALDKTSYKAGDTARVRIEPPFAGDVLLFIANDRVLETRDVAVPANGATVEIPVSSDWGAGAYVLATAFRPSGEGGERRHGPGRAVGVAWFGIDVTERVLGVSIDAPAEIKPNQRLDLPLTVTGVPQGQSAWVTLAAVDEGILLLTDFQSPDPTDHYFGRRALGVEMRDAYGRLIISDGRRGQVRSGGDAAAQQMSGLPKRSTRTVALYSGILPVGADGRVSVPLDLPDFDGELRLMAVAWTPTALGAASTAMKVRDPVIAEIGVPRFLAPGDKADVAFSLRNLSGPAGDYGVRVAVEGPLTVAAASAQFTATVAAGAEIRRPIPVTATATGVGKIRISVTGPDGFQRDRDWDLSVRPAQALTTDRIATLVQPNQSVVLNADLVKGFLPDTVQVFASFSTRPTFDIPGLLKTLDDYPYGCVEQTTSKALPLLYVAKVAEKVDSGFKPDDVHRKVQGAIDRIMTAQQPAGGFGMWSPFGDTNPWLSAYALDFLTRARAEGGYRIPERAYQRGIKYLSNYLDWYEARTDCTPASAYALYVVSRAGGGDVGTMRYYVDNCLVKYQTPVSQAQIAAAAAQFGDTARTAKAFAAAASTERPENFYGDYGSPLRDHAATAALLHEAKQPQDEVLQQVDVAADLFARDRYWSTQDMTWLLIAADAALDGATPLSLDIAGQAVADPGTLYRLNPGAAALAAGIAVKNTGSGPMRQVLTVRGVPAAPLPAGGDGFEIIRTYLDRDGHPIDPAKTAVKQGDLVTVLLRGRATDDLDHQALVVDLLPAGLEIENPSVGNGAKLGDIADTLSDTQHVEMRDDRYIAAIDLTGDTRTFTVAYLARAVTPGRFALPAPYVEDMYRPQYNARGGFGALTVEARK
ncbi:MAG: alpha-2-macroglobulin family protein [Inquilinus limosus]|uniref:Alpha-2-macroglobulin family protein n=1 Tax=Inquilinus limosus TaxID=171674 RepID=A0A952FV47_9PROT|nr:alpha-2-macroglobulin family protein [Inquilinus limosus]